MIPGPAAPHDDHLLQKICYVERCLAREIETAGRLQKMSSRARAQRTVIGWTDDGELALLPWQSSVRDLVKVEAWPEPGVGCVFRRLTTLLEGSA